MSTVLLSYATPNFYRSQRRLERSASRWGISRCLSLNSVWLRLFRRDFCRRNAELLKARTGAGWWVWKPYLIQQVLEHLRSGETLIYLDSGIEILGSLSPLVDCCRKNEGVATFTTGAVCAHWTKREVFLQLSCDEPAAWSAPVVAGGMLVLQNTVRARELIANWAQLCAETTLATDAPSKPGSPELAGFRAHRHDQSVLSVLAYLQGIQPYRSPCQYGDHLKPPEIRSSGETYARPPETMLQSCYGTLLNVHRRQNPVGLWRRPYYLSRMLYQALRLRNWESACSSY